MALLHPPFLDLTLPYDQPLGSFSLLTSVYESEIASKNGGLDLSFLRKSEPVSRSHKEHYTSFLAYRPFNMNNASIYLIAQQYADIPTPCSLLLQDHHELLQVAAQVYQVCYAHYVLASYYDNMFPHGCCKDSSRNVMISLLGIGYPQAAYALCDQQFDHACVLLPFTMEDASAPAQQGVILADPTSDQLWISLKKKPRNMVSVIFEKRWKYITQWGNGTDLYPTCVMDHSTLYCFLQQMKSISLKSEFYPIGTFFEKAYTHPIRTPFADGMP
ncbi:hypothetical protein HZB02_00280 [Candidatus Woesearchaeota archaeon]|nr:hypothetical protein [Candidatus Woesearchaeota archaeon]